MVQRSITYDIVEMNNTRRGSITFRRNSQTMAVEAVVNVEQKINGQDAPEESYLVINDVLSDGSTVLSAAEYSGLIGVLKKIYDHARDELAGV